MYSYQWKNSILQYRKTFNYTKNRLLELNYLIYYKTTQRHHHISCGRGIYYVIVSVIIGCHIYLSDQFVIMSIW